MFRIESIMGRNLVAEDEQALKELKILGAKLKNRRKQIGLTMQQVALSSGISRVTLQRVEAGEGSVSAAALMRVSISLGTKLVIEADSTKDLLGEITLGDYPGLSSLAWQLKPSTNLSPNEAWSIYTRNWRLLDKSLLSEQERVLLEKLKDLFGGGFDV
jgi:transcriptional regulator with XRE-family HTH domain